MAISEDQRAMLQLLLEGGQSYADIGGLLGVDASEVRSRARRALTELGGIDPDTQVGLTDYLLGQADPIGRADAARQLQSDPGTADLASKLATQLRVIAPKARLPELPGHVGTAPLAAPAPGVPTEATPASVAGPGAGGRAAGAVRSALDRIGGAVGSLGDRERRLPVALGAAVLLVIAVVLVIVNPFGGGGDGDSSTSSDQQAASGDDIEVVELEPQNGSGASGQAVIARVQDQPVLQINLSNLKPSGKNDNYIVWLYNSDQVAFPLARDQVGSDGTLTGAAAIPTALIPLLSQFKAIDVSLASNAQTQEALQAAAKAQQLPPHSGESVLRGTIGNIPPSVSELGTSTGATGGTGTDAGAGTGGTSTTP